MSKMFAVATILLSSAAAFTAAAAPPLQKRISPSPIHATSYTATPFTPPSPDLPTQNYIPLSRIYNDGKHSGIDKCPPGTSTAVQQVRPYAGISYMTDILLNGEKHTLTLDTGSSDTWLFKSDYQCRDRFGIAQLQTFCNAGTGYSGDFGKGNPLRDVRLSVRYGDETSAGGQFGFANVTVAGLTVVRQQIALVNESYWRGDNISAGLIGLGYPALTAAYINGNTSQRVEYDPIFTSMWKQNLTSPLFSVALRRDGVGYLAFGGLPPVRHSGNWASTRIVVSSVSRASSAVDYGFYSIVPDRFIYNGSAATNSDIYFMDTGSTLSYLPAAIAQQFNALFDPPADLIEGSYYVSCEQAAPAFAIQIGGVSFAMNPRDVISRVGNHCMSGIQDASVLGMLGGEGQPNGLIGDSFLNSVVAVHDVGAAQMRFATHLY